MAPSPPRQTLALTLCALGLVALSMGASCSAPDTNDLTVGPSIINPTLTITPSAFGTKESPQGTPTGTFTLQLKLNALASDAVDVGVESFTLVAASDARTLLAKVPISDNAPTAFHLEPGDTKLNIYELKFTAPVPIGDLCKAGQIRYTGTVLDKSRGRSIPIDGATFSPDGCPQ